jgi:NAD(P)-dependent dehydrogenase (short-subunit alcohol dehydrogenase family)
MSKTALSGQVVVVIGAGGLLGRSFVGGIAKAGGTVIAADLNPDAAKKAASGCSAPGGGAVVAATVDIGDSQSIDSLLENVSRDHGRVHAVVNSAYPRGPGYGRKLEDVQYGDFCANVNLHLGGYFLAMQRAALHFRHRGGGNIVNIASIYGVIAPRFDIYDQLPMTMPVEYAAIKSGIIHLSRYFAQYYKRDGVRVNCISPGGIQDGQPADFLRAYGGYAGTKGMLDATDVVGSLIFLLSDASNCMTGQNLVVDDGFSL